MSKDDEQLGTAYASTDCPRCGRFVALAGRGRRGETVELEGHCPEHGRVFYVTTIP